MQSQHVSLEVTTDANAPPNPQRPPNRRRPPASLRRVGLLCLCMILIAAGIVVFVSFSIIARFNAQTRAGACDDVVTPTAAGAGANRTNIDVHINVTLLRSAKSSYLSSTIPAATARQWLRQANARVWRAAGISLRVGTVSVAEINATAAFAFEQKRAAAAGSKFDVSKVGSLEELRPTSAVQSGNGRLHMYVVGDLPICGSALTGSLRGRGSFFVRERPCANHEELSEPLDVAAVVVAHEIGHVLSLPHYTLTPCNVMDYDNFGFALTRKQIEKARVIAASGFGYSKVKSNNPLD